MSLLCIIFIIYDSFQLRLLKTKTLNWSRKATIPMSRRILWIPMPMWKKGKAFQHETNNEHGDPCPIYTWGPKNANYLVKKQIILGWAMHFAWGQVIVTRSFLCAWLNYKYLFLMHRDLSMNCISVAKPIVRILFISPQLNFCIYLFFQYFFTK